GRNVPARDSRLSALDLLRVIPSRRLLLRGLLLLGGNFRQGLSDARQAVPVLFHVIRRPALVRHASGDLGRGYHVDRIPRTAALTQRAADAAFQVDVTKVLQGGLIDTRHLVNAIDGADLDTSVTTGAIVGPDDGQFLRKFLAWFTSGLRHLNSS